MKRTTYGSRSVKKERAKRLSKRLAIALAALGLGAYIFHEIFADSLARLSEKLNAAQATFERADDVSTVQANSEVLRMKLTELQAAQAKANQDYSAITREQQQEARLASTQMRANFDSVSKFVDALPLSPKGLKDNRELVRQQVESVDATTQRWVGRVQKDKSDSAPMLVAISAQLETYVAQISIVVLGDFATKVAEREKSVLERFKRFVGGQVGYVESQWRFYYCIAPCICQIRSLPDMELT